MSGDEHDMRVIASRHLALEVQTVHVRKHHVQQGDGRRRQRLDQRLAFAAVGDGRIAVIREQQIAQRAK